MERLRTWLHKSWKQKSYTCSLLSHAVLNSHPKDVHQVAFDCFGIDSSLTCCLVNLKHEVFTVSTDSGMVLSYAEARFFLQSFAG